MKIHKAVEYVEASGAGVPVDEALRSGEILCQQSRMSFEKSSEAAAHVPTPFPFEDLIHCASPVYRISPRPEDYVLVPVPIILSDIPNSNGVSFPARSLAKFSPSFGMPHFKTWVGKPTFNEHDNLDYTKARGLVVDSVMNPVRGHNGFFKVVALLAFDRSKDRSSYDRIASRTTNGYSMGAYLDHYTCSVCGARGDTKTDLSCPHVRPEDKVVLGATHDGTVICREAWYPCGFEVSRVDSPAYAMAISDMITVLEQRQ